MLQNERLHAKPFIYLLFQEVPIIFKNYCINLFSHQWYRRVHLFHNLVFVTLWLYTSHSNHRRCHLIFTLTFPGWLKTFSIFPCGFQHLCLFLHFLMGPIFAFLSIFSGYQSGFDSFQHFSHSVSSLFTLTIVSCEESSALDLCFFQWHI